MVVDEELGAWLPWWPHYLWHIVFRRWSLQRRTGQFLEASFICSCFSSATGQLRPPSKAIACKRQWLPAPCRFCPADWRPESQPARWSGRTCRDRRAECRRLSIDVPTIVGICFLYCNLPNKFGTKSFSLKDNFSNINSLFSLLTLLFFWC